MIDILLMILLTIAGLFAAAAFLTGAVAWLICAGEQGFIGLAAYAAAWFFLFPIMAGVSLLTGCAWIIALLYKNLRGY